VVLETPDGPREFPRGDFRRIVPGFWPPAEWEARREGAQAGGAEARFEAAWWALENGLTPEAEAMLRAAHAAEAGHQPTARMVAVLDRLAQPLPDPDLGPLGRILPGEARIARGPHVLLLHQHGAAEADGRVAVLERVLASFYLALAAQGFELPPPPHRLASAWFARQDDYREFLRAEVGPDFRTTSGYYHPTRGLVVACDARDRDDQKARRGLLLRRLRELDSAGAGRGRDRPRRTSSVSSCSWIWSGGRSTWGPRRTSRCTSWWRSPGWRPATTTSRSGCTRASPRSSRSSAGAAGPASAGRTTSAWPTGEGPGRPSGWPPCCATWASAMATGRRVRRGVGAGLLPAQGASPAVRRLPRPAADPGPRPGPPPDRTLAAFRAAFGEDLDALEASWHRYLDGLRTPLEAEAPPP
jgi:hypothetical protein